MASRLAAATSASGLAKLVDSFVDGLITAFFAVMSNVGMIAFMVANTVLGGVVLSATWSDHPSRITTIFAWAYSSGTSALLMALWKSSWRLSWKAILPLVPALVFTVIDTCINLRFVTLFQYGIDVVNTSGLVPPHPTFMWWLKEAAVFMTSVFGLPGVLVIRSVRDHSLRIGSRRTATAPAAPADDPSLASA